MTLKDVWYLCDDPEWLQHAAGMYEAGECLVQLRVMSLGRKLENLLMEVRTAERLSQDTTELVNEYTEAMKQHQDLQTKAGRFKFIDEILADSYQEWKARQEEVLPL